MFHHSERLLPYVRLCLAALCFVAAAPVLANAQRAARVDKIELDRAKGMLAGIRDELKKTYFDPSFRGIDIDARFKQAAGKIDSAATLGQAFAVIAQVLLDFDDSHTYFVPPARTTRYNYGFQMQMVGDRCHVVSVKKGSHAAQVLKPGDLVLSIEGFKPSRADLWKMRYLYYSLNPRPALRVEVQGTDGAARAVEVRAAITQGKRMLDLTGADGGGDIEDLLRGEEREAEERARAVRIGDAAIWKLADFEFDSPQIERGAREALKGASSLVLDLRGNPGGYVETLERFAGYFFTADTKIADVKGRTPMKPMMAKKREPAFTGRVVVLVDSESGSAAELFARLMQIEKRGVVIGDRSAGSVMQGHFFSGSMGADRLILYGASITDADVIMTDGRSLERQGVTPDETVLPTAEDLAAGRDPVLARAAASVGLALDATAAGALFRADRK